MFTRRFFLTNLVAVSLLASCGCGDVIPTLKVHVQDADTSQPVGNATVTITNGSRSVSGGTDIDGDADFIANQGSGSLRTGDNHVIVSAPGYGPAIDEGVITLKSGDDKTFPVVLKRPTGNVEFRTSEVVTGGPNGSLFLGAEATVAVSPGNNLSVITHPVPNAPLMIPYSGTLTGLLVYGSDNQPITYQYSATFTQFPRQPVSGSFTLTADITTSLSIVLPLSSLGGGSVTNASKVMPQ